MAAVYILYSSTIDKYYVGSCKDIMERIDQHLSKYLPGGFATTASDWLVYYSINNLKYSQVRKIEIHIKRMKSKKYIEDLKKYPEISFKLIALYQ